MTQDEIIRSPIWREQLVALAREAGAIQVDGKTAFYTDDLERFAALVAAHEKKFCMEQIEVECNEAVLAERWACAKVCEEMWAGGYGPSAITAAIRARSNHG